MKIRYYFCQIYKPDFIEFVPSFNQAYDSGVESSKYYIVRYSFTEMCGKTYNKKFEKYKLDDLKKGDKIIVYYDVNNPNKCVIDHRLNADKNLWWKALIIAAVIIVVPFVFGFVFNNM